MTQETLQTWQPLTDCRGRGSDGRGLESKGGWGGKKENRHSMRTQNDDLGKHTKTTGGGKWEFWANGGLTVKWWDPLWHFWRETAASLHSCNVIRMLVNFKNILYYGFVTLHMDLDTFLRPCSSQWTWFHQTQRSWINIFVGPRTAFQSTNQIWGTRLQFRFTNRVMHLSFPSDFRDSHG